MKRLATKLFILMMIVCGGCIDSYNPSEVSGNVKYLVVDGFLDSTEGTCTVTLTRTIPLEASGIQYEVNAQVILEDEEGEQSTLSEQNEGQYKISGLFLDDQKKYKITITTQDQQHYESELVSVFQTPAIDSVTWKEDRNGVAIAVNSHDPAGAAHYYYWKFVETWVYHAAYNSVLIQTGDTVRFRNPEEGIYECWRTLNSTTILVGSSDKLEEDIIREFNLTTLPWKSEKMQIKYSILVEQRAISLQAFEYWQLLKKNTEQLGSIFDPLPSSSIGNIRCLTNPQEIVLGYFNAGETETKRIFISRREVEFPNIDRPVTGYEDCTMFIKLFGESYTGYMPIQFENAEGGGPPVPIGYSVSVPRCVDCRLMGGVITRPDFWK